MRNPIVLLMPWTMELLIIILINHGINKKQDHKIDDIFYGYMIGSHDPRFVYGVCILLIHIAR